MLLLPTEKIEAPILGLRNPYMPAHDTEMICELLNQIHPKEVVEFGINKGETAREILRYVPGIEIYVGIDVLPGHMPTLPVQSLEIPTDINSIGQAVMADRRFRLIVRDGGSRGLDPCDIGSCDAALIDGDHSYAGIMNDTALARACVRPGGIILWHDYHEGSIGVLDVTTALEDMARENAQIKHAEGTWIAFERIP